MEKIITMLSLLTIGLSAHAQTREARTTLPFNKLDVSDGIQVIYSQAPQTSVIVESRNMSDLEDLSTQIHGETLRIRYNGNPESAVKVLVSSPELKAVKASDKSNVFIASPLKGTEFQATLSTRAIFSGTVSAVDATLYVRSGGIINMKVEAQTLTGTFNQDAKANLCGTVNKSALTLTANALLAARNLVCSSSSVNASGKAIASVNAAREMNVEVEEDARISYFGMPVKVATNPEAISTVRSNARRSLATLN